MSAAGLKERLRADLKAAMQARAGDDVRLLRTLIAALDNAEAVPRDPSHDNLPRAFGDPSAEVAGRKLDGGALETLLQTEIDARLSAAKEYDRLHQDAEAARLRTEAELIERYRA